LIDVNAEAWTSRMTLEIAIPARGVSRCTRLFAAAFLARRNGFMRYCA
jgi:hypothetical protein